MSKLETIEIETGKNPTASVIWMHGLGADGNDFVPIVGELGLDKGPAVRFVFPHAPMRPVTINNGFVMRAWYDVTFGDLEGKSRKPDEQGVRDSEAQIGALIEREMKRGIPAGSIVLAGFSQGGAIALQTGLRYPEKLAGDHGALDLSAARRRAAAGSLAGQQEDSDFHGARHLRSRRGLRHGHDLARHADRAGLQRRVARVSDAALGVRGGGGGHRRRGCAGC